MNSSDATLQKDRVGTANETGSSPCPNCGSSEATVPVVTVEGTTLWRCSNECPGTWTGPSADHEGLTDTPAPERVLDRLIGAARYHEDGDVLRAARAVSTLYRDAGIEVPNIDWAAHEDRLGRARSAELVADD